MKKSRFMLAGAISLLSTTSYSEDYIIKGNARLSKVGIPANATSLGAFIIPNGKTLNNVPNNSILDMHDNSIVVFQYRGPGLGYIVQQNPDGGGYLGTGNYAYFSNSSINADNYIHAIANDPRAPGSFSWEDQANSGYPAGSPNTTDDLSGPGTGVGTYYGNGIVNMVVTNTGTNQNIPLSTINPGTNLFDITGAQSLRINLTPATGIDSPYLNTVGYYFADAAGVPISGQLSYADFHTGIGITATTNPTRTTTNSTFQFYNGFTIYSDVQDATIAAINIVSIPANPPPILQVEKSVTVGSVTNQTGIPSNSLSVRMQDNTGVTFNGSDYSGLLDVYSFGTPGSTSLTIAAPSPVIISAPVGKTVYGVSKGVGSFNISGQSVTLNNALVANNINFTSSTTPSTLTLGAGYDLGATPVTTAATTRIHNLAVKGNQNITGNIGSATNSFGTITLLDDSTVNVKTANFYSAINTSANGMGHVIFKMPGTYFSVGGVPDGRPVNNNTNALASVDFQATSNIKGGASANTITVKPGAVISFLPVTSPTGGLILPSVTATESLVLEGTGSGVIFSDGATVNAPISTLVDNQSTFTSQGSITLRSRIGEQNKKLLNVNFNANTPDKTIVLPPAIYSVSTSFAPSRVVLNQNTLIKGTTATFASTNIDFNQNNLTLSDNTIFTGTQVFNLSFDGVTNSKLTASANNVDLSGVNSLTFNINDISGLPPVAGRQYNFFNKVGGGTITLPPSAKVRLNPPSNPLVKWSYNGNTGTFSQVRDFATGIRTIAFGTGGRPTATALANALKLADPASGGSAEQFMANLINLANTDPEKASQALARLLSSTNPTGNILIQATKTVQLLMSVRLNNNLAYQFRLSEDDGISGVSAGDDSMDSRFSAWAAPLYSQSHLKASATRSGNSSRSGGAAIGFDGKINEDLKIGIAETLVNTEIKYKGNNKDGNKTTINSLVSSIYGLQDLSENWFTQGIASFGYNRVRNTKVRINTDLVAIASKYTSRMYGAEILAGYNYKFDDTAKFTPTLGFRYDRFFSNKYRDQGDVLPMYTSTATIDRFDGILGTKVAKMIAMENGTVLTPEVHGNLHYHIIDKAPSYTIRLDGMVEPMIMTTRKSSKALYNVGASLGASHNMMEYSLGYDSTIAKKYLGHQGTLKISVNF